VREATFDHDRFLVQIVEYAAERLVQGNVHDAQADGTANDGWLGSRLRRAPSEEAGWGLADVRHRPPALRREIEHHGEIADAAHFSQQLGVARIAMARGVEGRLAERSGHQTVDASLEGQ
jgi:hypothetical protein